MSGMVTEAHELHLSTGGGVELHDVTAEVSGIVARSGMREGLAVVHVPGSTGAMTTIEHEPGLREDLGRVLESLIPSGGHYAHDARWGDGNGHSHVRASLIGPSISVPVQQGRLVLGTWQQMVFVELDNRPRQRALVVQLVGTR